MKYGTKKRQNYETKLNEIQSAQNSKVNFVHFVVTKKIKDTTN